MAETTPMADNAPWSEWVRGWTECAEQSRQAFARAAIDGIEAAVDSAIAYERRVAEAVPLEWVREAIVVRTSVADEAKSAWVKAARAAMA